MTPENEKGTLSGQAEDALKSVRCLDQKSALKEVSSRTKPVNSSHNIGTENIGRLVDGVRR